MPINVRAYHVCIELRGVNAVNQSHERRRRHFQQQEIERKRGRSFALCADTGKREDNCT